MPDDGFFGPSSFSNIIPFISLLNERNKWQSEKDRFGEKDGQDKRSKSNFVIFSLTQEKNQQTALFRNTESTCYHYKDLE